MAIVDFEQDPSADLGTGNFRDDKGRVMYLHDPETAGRFIKTMPGQTLGGQIAAESDVAAGREMGDPGATLGSQVALESDAIARQRLGEPPRGPDRRLAEVRPPQQGGAGANLIHTLNAATGPVSDVPTPAVDAAAPETPAEAPVAPGAAPAAPGSAPGGAPGAGQPGAAGAALVQAVGSYDARSKPREVATPKPFPSGRLPLGSVRQGEGVSIEEGRPLENVVEQAGVEDRGFKENVETPIREAYAAKDKAADAGFKSGITSAALTYGQGVDEQFRQRAARREAEQRMQSIQQEIKKNDSAVDSERVVKNMSTGKKLTMIILAALNGAFGAVIGQKDNGVVTALNDAIDRDIERQKFEVANRKVSLGNDYKRFLDIFGDAKLAEDLARHKAEGALLSYNDLEQKRTAAQGAFAREGELLLAPLKQAHLQRQGDIYASGEAKIKRTQDVGMTHEVPQMLMTPQAQLAEFSLKKEQIEQANADKVAALLGHPVTAEEAAKLKQDAQEFVDKDQVNQDALYKVDALREALGMRKENGVWVGNPDPGSRPLGISLTDRSVRIDRLWNDVLQAQVQRSKREPAARIQDAQGKAIERPFYDDQIPALLSDIEGVVRNSSKGLATGYGEAAKLGNPTQGTSGSTDKPPGRPGAKPAPKPNGRAGNAREE